MCVAWSLCCLRMNTFERTMLTDDARARSCNFHGNQAWTLALPWSGHDHFSNEPLRPWYASEEEAKAQNATRAGEYRQYGRLAFAGVDGAGHFVPYDKPEAALALVNRWIFDRKVGYA